MKSPSSAVIAVYLYSNRLLWAVVLYSKVDPALRESSSAVGVEKSGRKQGMQVSEVKMLDRFVLVNERRVSFDTDSVSHLVSVRRQLTRTDQILTREAKY